MDCRQFENMLEQLLDGAATAEQRRAADDHRSACSGCYELDALVRGEVPVSSEESVDLTASILERTSGSPCGQAEGMLCDAIDGELRGADANLLALHKAHCHECAAIEIALARLQSDLRALALADPGPRFAEQVLARTLSLDQRLVRLGRRLREGWVRLSQRPRIVWEASYIGAFVLFLIFGSAASPLREVPGQALALAQVNPLHMLRDSPLALVPGVVSSWGQGAWNVTGAKVVRSSEAASLGLQVRLARASQASKDLIEHGKKFAETLFQGNLTESLPVLKSMGGDLLTIWNRLVVEIEEPTTSPSPNSTEGEEHGRRSNQP